MSWQPKTGHPCTCKRGVQRDNCPACEGTGQRIDFAAIHRERKAREAMAANPVCPNCGQWQHAGNGGDCLNECKRRGFAPR
jgi:RNA polymerase subunit RPABC4/transcription elongation factor Spt4